MFNTAWFFPPPKCAHTVDLAREGIIGVVVGVMVVVIIVLLTLSGIILCWIVWWGKILQH